MSQLLTDFIAELREVGIPISMVEAIDAARALGETDLSEREFLRSALSSTLVKHARFQPAFDICFDIFFGLTPPRQDPDQPEDSDQSAVSPPEMATGGGGDGSELSELVASLVAALTDNDQIELRRLIAQAVDQLAGIEPGRPVGGTYYLYRTLRQLDPDRIETMLTDRLDPEPETNRDQFEQRLVDDLISERMDQLRQALTAEIRSRLVADRGRAAVAKTLRTPLAEEIDLMHASRTDLVQIEQLIGPLTAKLATKLARKRKHNQRGRLDFRRTIRASLSSGGIPMELRYKTHRPHRPEIFLLCDISGSMATFARFALQFTWAMSTQFSRLRAFVFVDAVDEITDYITPAADFGSSLSQIFSQADVTWTDGHSDYGHVFSQLREEYGGEFSSRSTLIVTGDARNNYRSNGAEHLGKLAHETRAVFWLNPEPEPYWDSGDSVMSSYRPFCDGVYEVRNLRQLEHFVEEIALPATPFRHRVQLSL